MRNVRYAVGHAWRRIAIPCAPRAIAASRSAGSIPPSAKTGTRVPVSVVVGSVADGDTWDEILADYPQLKREDIQAALLYAAEAVNRFEMIPAVS